MAPWLCGTCINARASLVASTARPAPIAEPPAGGAPSAPVPLELPAHAADAVSIDTGHFAPASTPTTTPPQASLATFTLAHRPPSPPPRTATQVPMERAAAQAPALIPPPARSQGGRPVAPSGGRRVIVTQPGPMPTPARGVAQAAPAAAPAMLQPPAPLAEELPPVIEELMPAATLPAPAVEVRPEAPAAPVSPDLLDGVTSIEYGARPEPGMQRALYLWRDVLDGDAPARAKYGEGAYAVYHSIDIDESVRITHQTLVHVRATRRRKAGGEEEHRIVADARVSVQKRALLEVMDEVRQFADQRAARQREALARKLAKRRSAALQQNRLSRRVAFARIRGRARMSNSLIRTQRRVLRGLVEVPDSIISGALRVESHLSTRLGRQDLAVGLADSRKLTQDQRSALLFLTAVGLLAGVLLASLAVALVVPEYATVYRRLLQDAGTQFVGLFGLPIPIELPFIFSLAAMGPALAFTGFFLGKMIGAWVLYLLGDSVRHHLEKKSKAKGQGPPKLLTWMESKGQKYGFVLLILDNALPLAPDQLMLVLAVTGMRLRSWMWGIAIGSAIKYGALIAGYYYFGPEFVEGFFSRPWEYF